MSYNLQLATREETSDKQKIEEFILGTVIGKDDPRLVYELVDSVKEDIILLSKEFPSLTFVVYHCFKDKIHLDIHTVCNGEWKLVREITEDYEHHDHNDHCKYTYTACFNEITPDNELTISRND